MKPRIEINIVYPARGYGDPDFDWKFKIVDEIESGSLVFEDGSLFMEKESGRRFRLRFEEIACTDC